MTRIKDAYDYDAEDIKHDAAVVREMDDADEAKTLAMAQRNAAGISPEVLSLQDAHLEGLRAGSQGTAAGCNPWADPALPEYQAWERGRSAAELARLNKLRRVA